MACTLRHRLRLACLTEIVRHSASLCAVMRRRAALAYAVGSAHDRRELITRLVCRLDEIIGPHPHADLRIGQPWW